MSDRQFDRAVRGWLDDGSDRTPPAAIDAVLLAVKTTSQERDLRILPRTIQMPTYLRLAAVIAIVAVLGLGALMYLGKSPGVGGEPTPTSEPSASPSPAASTATSLLDTSTWTTYTSDRYGFSIAHPADWSEDPADHDWTFENDINAFQSSGTESFATEGSADGMGVRVSAWSAPVDPGTTVDDWIGAYCGGQTQGPVCTEVLNGLVDVETGDRHPGVLSAGTNRDTMAFFLDGQTIYVVAIWRPEDDPAVQPYGGGRRLLEAFLSTMTLSAEPAQESPAG
jgi:hypothetical protein